MPATAESQFKAAFLYSLVKFVQWPPTAFASADSAVVVGVVGSEVLRGVLEEAVEKRPVQKRRVQVRRFADSTDVAALRECHVLFFGSSQKARARELLEALKGAPVLTVGEWDQFVESGGMVEVLVVDDKLAFVVNHDVVEAGNLKISSQLLKLAKAVYRASND